MLEKGGFKIVVQSDSYVRESGIYCKGFNSIPCEMFSPFLTFPNVAWLLHGGGGGNNSKGYLFMLNYKCRVTIRVLCIRPFQQRKLRFPGSRLGPRAPVPALGGSAQRLQRAPQPHPGPHRESRERTPERGRRRCPRSSDRSKVTTEPAAGQGSRL